jgi:meiotically up-regulated gene 157 (Mug157) protein
MKILFSSIIFINLIITIIIMMKVMTAISTVMKMKMVTSLLACDDDSGYIHLGYGVTSM